LVELVETKGRLLQNNNGVDTMSIGIWELLLILAIVFVLFGAGKLPQVMADLGKGVKSLKEGLKGDAKKEEGKKSAENFAENNSDKNS
jgi:sec-independent protein translocase protein TatA